MSVVIQNMGYTLDKSSGRTDECLYVCRVNTGPNIAKCLHFRSDGLAALLRKMADAIDVMEER